MLLALICIRCIKAFSCKFQVSREQAATIAHMIREVCLLLMCGLGIKIDGIGFYRIIVLMWEYWFPDLVLPTSSQST